jgi:hypothetical protein
MRSKLLRLVPFCLGLALLLAAWPAGAAPARAERLLQPGRGLAATPAPEAPASALLLAVWSALAEAGLLPPPPPSPPSGETTFSTDNSDQGATLDPNGTP